MPEFGASEEEVPAFETSEEEDPFKTDFSPDETPLVDTTIEDTTFESSSEDFESTSFDESPVEETISFEPAIEEENLFKDESADLEETDTFEPEPEPVSSQNLDDPENFEDLKTFAENSSLSGMGVEGNPSFSVLIKNVRFIEDVQDILTLLRELKLLTEADEDQVESRLMRGQLLVPRISEFAAIMLAHKLRRFDIDIQVGLSDEIHPPKHKKGRRSGWRPRPASTRTNLITLSLIIPNWIFHKLLSPQLRSLKVFRS